MAELWTSRDVNFRTHPETTQEQYEALADAAVDLYWETWRHRVFGTLAIGRTGHTLNVNGWPWWVPKWCARRSVANLAASVGVGGDAECRVLRTVLT